MVTPLVVEIPHKLGRDEARRRVAAGVGKLSDHIPGGQVKAAWAGDRLDLAITAMGQAFDGRLDIAEQSVRVELQLPGMLGMFAAPIEAMLRTRGAAILTDGREAS